MKHIKKIVGFIYQKNTEISKMFTILSSILALTYISHLNDIYQANSHKNTSINHNLKDTMLMSNRSLDIDTLIVNVNTTTVQTDSSMVIYHKPKQALSTTQQDLSFIALAENLLFINKKSIMRFLWFGLLISTLCYYLKRRYGMLFEKPQMVFFVMLNLIIMVTVIIGANLFFEDYLYVIPFSILGIIFKNFWDAPLALFVQNICLLCLAFLIPNYLEFFTLSFFTGTISIIGTSNLYRRNSLIWIMTKIMLTYSMTYAIFVLVKTNDFNAIKHSYFLFFLINGILTFLVSVLIWIYEKTFGLLSEITLLELSNTSNKLLKELNEKAPGTFQHTVQVADLAEDVAYKIDANVMLTKVGALYHDIGKMTKPLYFTENQTTQVNPHDELSPEESAQIIIEHIISGIELARKHNLPDQIIDFIRSHHGNSLVYFFYRKQLNSGNQPIDETLFRYKGPRPFSKETVILMMCDSVEAACCSLPEPTEEKIENLIEKIIEKQLLEQQYINAPITLKEVNTAKEVLKQKLKSIYHTRIAYPS